MVLWSFRAINYSKTNLMQWTDVALFFRKEFKSKRAHLDIAGLDGQHFRKPMEISRPVLANVKQELFVEEEPKECPTDDNSSPPSSFVLWILSRKFYKGQISYRTPKEMSFCTKERNIHATNVDIRPCINPFWKSMLVWCMRKRLRKTLKTNKKYWRKHGTWNGI